MQKLITIFSMLIFIFAVNSSSFAQLFSDDFESGTASPDWGFFWEGEDIVTAVPMTNAPVILPNGGDYLGWLQDIDTSYNGAALSVAGETTLQDYSIEADVYCYVNHPQGAAYTGIAFYADPDTNINTYIKMVADFDQIPYPRIRLYNNHLDLGTMSYTFEHSFVESDIPGGIPTEDGWHHMKVEVRTISADITAFWCYWDGVELLGCPIADTSADRMSSGQFGLFSFSMTTGMGLPGYFDNIVVNDVSTSVEDISNGSLPEEFALEQNYPNPFNPSTQISYKLSSGNHVSLTIHDLLGREIKTLVSGFQSAGHYSVTWNGEDKLGHTVPSGVYLYSLNTGGLLISKKMVLMK